MKFNEAQLKAISHGNGPMLVLAGPGSGKTTVITERIAHLIRSGLCAPEEILAVTFSKAAAGEMANRFKKISPGQGAFPVFGTFHSVFLNILKKEYPERIFSIITSSEKSTFIRSEIERLKLPSENSGRLEKDIILKISKVKTGAADISLESYAMQQIMRGYRSYMQTNALIDFDDIILMCADLFESSPDALSGWQRRFRYILVDEFQDISPLQYKVMRLLSEKDKNIFVVGDDDQSIYGFRGAAPLSLKAFLRDFPGAEPVLLNINYRCAPSILKASLKVISANKDRFEKEISAPYETALTPGTFSIKDYLKRTEEYAAIISQIRALLAEGEESIAILFRNIADSQLLLKTLSDAQIPFSAPESNSGFLSHFTSLDMLAYLDIAFSKDRFLKGNLRKDFLRIANRPVRYIARDSLLCADNSNVSECFSSMYEYYIGVPKMIKRINLLYRNISSLSGLSPYAAVKYIRNSIGYESWLFDYAAEKGIEAEDLFMYLDSFEEYAASFDCVSEFFKKLSEPVPADNLRKRSDTACVHVMTMHASKGMEFNTVFIPDANDSIIPNKKSLEEGSENEERRLFYVAMTRAKRNLFISHVHFLHNKSALPSRFIKDIL